MKAQHVLLTIKVLDAYAQEVIEGFPLEASDKLVGRVKSAGCTELTYEIAQSELRSSQRGYLDETHEGMIDRLELLRNVKEMRGRTLFQWRSYAIAAPCHDVALLNRRSWKEQILLAAAT